MTKQVTKTTRGKTHTNTTERAEAVSQRPRKRVPVSGFRDIMTVAGKNPEYEYRWVIDSSENGQRLMRFQAAWWEFVRSDEGIEVGEESVYQTENVGSIIRTPAGGGKFNYLMKIKKEYYDEDQQAKVKRIEENEQAITNVDTADGQYGEVKITRD